MNYEYSIKNKYQTCMTKGFFWEQEIVHIKLMVIEKTKDYIKRPSEKCYKNKAEIEKNREDFVRRWSYSDGTVNI